MGNEAPDNIIVFVGEDCQSLILTNRWGAMRGGGRATSRLSRIVIALKSAGNDCTGDSRVAWGDYRMVAPRS